MIGLTKRTVELVKYSATWVNEYKNEVANLKSILKIPNQEKYTEIEEIEEVEEVEDNLDAIFEHVGSTSIKGMIAKPIIDILIGLRKPSDLLKAKKALIKADKYNYVPQINIPNLVLLTKSLEDQSEVITHHVLLTKLGSEKWTEMILFRNYLRRNKSVANSYMVLKDKLSKEFSEERIEYSKAKGKFIDTITKRATILHQVKKNKKMFNQLNYKNKSSNDFQLYMQLYKQV